MRVIAHLSDLHFGTEDPAIVEGLLIDLKAQSPDLVVISGDFTQRARRRQFDAAQQFLRKIPFPCLSVPGNHDIPLYDVFRRFTQPLERYKKYISPDVDQLYSDSEIIVLGINTARSATFKNGRIAEWQLELIRRAFCGTSEAFRILVTHHPFVPPEGRPRDKVIGRGSRALAVLEKCGADLLLSGHFHLGYSGDVRSHYKRLTRSMIVVQAGTTLSNRRRGEPNSYNKILVNLPELTLQVRGWDQKSFRPATETIYRRVNDEWLKPG